MARRMIDAHEGCVGNRITYRSRNYMHESRGKVARTLSADAVHWHRHRHANAGWQECNKPTRGARTHTQQHQAHTQPGHHHHPGKCRTPASRHSRGSAQARSSGLAGAERAKTSSQTKALLHAHDVGMHAKARVARKSPASRHSRCSAQAAARAGLRDQTPLAEHAHIAPQPRSIAWEGGGEAAMKGGAPCFCRGLLAAYPPVAVRL